ncbi:MOS1T transposase, partial [Pseudoatta argentina]
ICRDWFRRFKNNDFQLEDKERSGAPKKFQDKELEQLLDEKRHGITQEAGTQEHENEGPRNNESPGYPALGPPCEPEISCSGAHRVRLVSAISTGEKMIAIAGWGGGGGSYHERRVRYQLRNGPVRDFTTALIIISNKYLRGTRAYIGILRWVRGIDELISRFESRLVPATSLVSRSYAQHMSANETSRAIAYQRSDTFDLLKPLAGNNCNPVLNNLQQLRDTAEETKLKI